MADPQTPKPKKKVDVLDFSKPIWTVLDQTESRNNVKFFQGPKAEAEAKALASDIALNSERPAAVFGPQCAVKVPPQTKVADDMALDFGDKPKS